jgi:predicted transcriptional regulator/transcriptional regulator with XRE-family HTH domain
MAGRLGISPSYLNLIENDRRPLTAALLRRLVDVYGVEAQAFLADSPARLRAELAESVGDPQFPGPRLDDRALTELATAMPEAARTLAAVTRAYLAARKEARGLAERLAGDPFLAAARHNLLTRLTSIRSYSEILRDNVDLEVPRRQRFVGVLVDESQHLTALVNEVFAFLADDGTPGLIPAASPEVAVADRVRAHNNHFPDLEQAADSLRQSLAAPPSGLYAALVETLRLAHGVTVHIAEDGSGREGSGQDGPGQEGSGPAAPGQPGEALVIPETVTLESRTFRVARHLALLACRPAIEARLAEAGALPPAEADLYRWRLGGYVAGALIMPYEPFRQSAGATRHDLERLQHRFGASFTQVCHRLTTLQRPGAEGVPFHFVRVDIAGNVRHSFSASGLHIPRHGGLCPRWNVHLAFLNPGCIDTQIVQLPDGARYAFIAKALSKRGNGGRGPRSHTAVAIGCDISFASHLIYADGLALGEAAHDVPVGLSCRHCPRHDCAQRAEPRHEAEAGRRTWPMTTTAGPQ